MKQEPFTKEKLIFINNAIKKHDLDARLILGTLNSDWSHIQDQIYGVPFQGMKAWIVPMRSNPERMLGLGASMETTDDGILVTTTMTKRALCVPHDAVPIALDTVVTVQIRGIAWDKKPVTIFVTCNKRNWEDKLMKRLAKLTPVLDGTKRIYNYDLIEDTMVL